MLMQRYSLDREMGGQAEGTEKKKERLQKIPTKMGGKITLVRCQYREGGGQLDKDRRLDHSRCRHR
jgi:hypothetical protein